MIILILKLFCSLSSLISYFLSFFFACSVILLCLIIHYFVYSFICRIPRSALALRSQVGLTSQLMGTQQCWSLMCFPAALPWVVFSEYTTSSHTSCLILSDLSCLFTRWKNKLKHIWQIMFVIETHMIYCPQDKGSYSYGEWRFDGERHLTLHYSKSEEMWKNCKHCK